MGPFKNKFHIVSPAASMCLTLLRMSSSDEVIENHFKSTFTSADDQEIIVIGIIIAGGASFSAPSKGVPAQMGISHRFPVCSN